MSSSQSSADWQAHYSSSDSESSFTGSTSWLQSTHWLGERLFQYLAAACLVFELALVIPTAWVEHEFMVATRVPWPFALRLLMSTVRLLPVLRFVAARACLLLRGPRLWRCCVPQVVRWRIQSSGQVLQSPEVRWGVAITLDMWYLLSTPLNVGLQQVWLGLLLVANICLCFIDTVTLLSILSTRTQPVEVYPERAFRRARHIKLDQAAPTCAICLCDFEQEESAVELPCKHVFHCDCITIWLQRSRRCPMRCPELVLPPRRIRQTQADSQPEPLNYGNPVQMETEQLIPVVSSIPGQVPSEGTTHPP
mmetsp:Transcript_56139/g.131214  ORF Transcript_56139/g.131214 Transcript_56139/m.131214 type:complete len:308 (-) Transcript_56139:229-1152(-)